MIILIVVASLSVSSHGHIGTPNLTVSPLSSRSKTSAHGDTGSQSQQPLGHAAFGGHLCERFRTGELQCL